jgi:tetratricopeptide (TPR) repeat protein
MFVVGIATFALGRDEESAAWLNRSIELSPNLPVAHFYLAAALAHLGRIEDAREAARVGLELNPYLTIARLRSTAFSDNPAYLASRERLYEGMRLVGAPEE